MKKPFNNAERIKAINDIAPNNPQKDIPTKPDKNPDPTVPKPGGNEPRKNDPTRIQEPSKTDPTRIDNPATPPSTPKKAKQNHKLSKVKSWEEVLAKFPH